MTGEGMGAAVGRNEPPGNPGDTHKEGHEMKKITIAACAVLFAASIASAAGPKSYQVTGPVLEIRDDVIVVEKGKEKWEIAKGADLKVKGELKVGAKVTVEYKMTAVSVEAKEAKAAKKK